MLVEPRKAPQANSRMAPSGAPSMYPPPSSIGPAYMAPRQNGDEMAMENRFVSLVNFI